MTKFLHTLDMRWWIERKREKLVMWIARHLPREVRKWVVVYAAIKAKPEYPGECTYPQMHDAA